MSNGLDPDQDRRCVGPDPGSNCLQGYQLTTKIAASRQILNSVFYYQHFMVSFFKEIIYFVHLFRSDLLVP